MKRKCITCDGEGELTTTCEHCGVEHSCTCPNCKGTGKLLYFDALMLCEIGNSVFTCPLTEKKRCINTRDEGKCKRPYNFKVINGFLIRTCVCDDHSGKPPEWKLCHTKFVDKPLEFAKH